MLLANPAITEQTGRESGPAAQSGPCISVVVPTYRRPDLLKRCVTALAAQTLHPSAFEVIVADDEPSEVTRTLVERCSQSSECSVRYVAVRGPHGPAAARNAGWHAASADI